MDRWSNKYESRNSQWKPSHDKIELYQENPTKAPNDVYLFDEAEELDF